MIEQQPSADFVWLLKELSPWSSTAATKASPTASEALGRAPKDFSADARETAATGIWSN